MQLKLFATLTRTKQPVTHMATELSLYLIIISAYLIVAYLAVSKLTQAQACIASALMVFSAGGQTYALSLTTSRVVEYLALKQELAPLTAYEQNFEANTYPWIFILSCGILAALYFMWSVRHPKTG